jgi:uncharacterized RDD family membrane protein YckC
MTTTQTAPDPRALLAAYGAALESANDLPRLLLLRRRRGRVGRFLLALRLRVFVRFFVLFHVGRTLASLRRLYNRGAALDPRNHSYETGARQVEAFERSLPTHHARRMLVLLLLSVFFASFVMARLVPDFDPTFLSKLGDSRGEPAPTLRVSADSLGQMTGASLTLNPREFANALESFACFETGSGDAREYICSPKRGLTTGLASLILLGIALWLVMFFPTTSFRLKRMLFNLGPAGVDTIRSEVAIEHVQKAEGVYRIEADVFRRLGARPPREVPFDLLSQAGVLVLPVWVSLLIVPVTVSWLRYVREDGLYDGDILVLALLVYCALLVFTLPCARLVSLRRTSRRRGLVALEGEARSRTPAAEPASRRRRLLGHLIDAAFVAAIGIPLALLLSAGIGNDELRALLVLFVVPVLAWGLYEAFSLLRTGPRSGQTIGKQLVGLRVVSSADGQVPVLRRLLFRNLLLRGLLFGPATLALPFVFTDYAGFTVLLVLPFLAYALNYLFALCHYRQCTLHDLISDTMVVREARSPAFARVALSHQG